MVSVPNNLATTLANTHLTLRNATLVTDRYRQDRYNVVEPGLFRLSRTPHLGRYSPMARALTDTEVGLVMLVGIVAVVVGVVFIAVSALAMVTSGG